MECNTKTDARQAALMEASSETWEQLIQPLTAQVSLEDTAQASRAIVRHRGIKRAGDLLRVLLGYAVCDWSFRTLGAWFALEGLGQISAVALREHLRQSVGWLGMLLGAMLRLRCERLAEQPGVRLRLMDATVVSRPGSRGSDWRVHLSLDLGGGCLTGVEVTDAHGAETLARFPVQPQEIRVADRGYAFASGLGPILAAGGRFVIRANWQNLPWQRQDESRLQVAHWLHSAFRYRRQTPHERRVWLQTPQGRFRLRLIAIPLPAVQAAAARRRARQAAHKKGRTLKAQTLQAAGFVLLLTNLEPAAWPMAQVAALYRLRWQIEIRIKRLKSVLNLDGLRSQNPQVAQAYLLAKLLGALLLDALTGQVQERQPDWVSDPERPLNWWRLSAWCWQSLRDAIRGAVSWAKVLASLPQLGRYVRDEPRRRRSQYVTAQSLIAQLVSC